MCPFTQIIIGRELARRQRVHVGAIDDGGGDQAIRQIVSPRLTGKKRLAVMDGGQRLSEKLFVRKMDLGARFRFATDRHLRVVPARPVQKIAAKVKPILRCDPGSSDVPLTFPEGYRSGGEGMTNRA